MPDVSNYTPFPNLRYYSEDNGGRRFGVVAVKATYQLDASGRLVVAEEQAPMVFTDLCHGAVNVSSLWHPSDLVPKKPATDVIVNAVARCPAGRREPSWLCGVRIEDEKGLRLDKRLRVTGPRQWLPEWKRPLREAEKPRWREHRQLFSRWVLSEPEPIEALPLRYEHAYGGMAPRGEDENGAGTVDTDHRNPIGCGRIDPDWTDHTAPLPAPQIESPDAPVAEPYARMRPESLGPIPPAWLPRRPFGGTYDQNWKDNVWPAWPADYDFAYHNSAHPDLIVKPFLGGRERVTLAGLADRSEPVSFELPGEALLIEFVTPEGETESRRMDLDTLFLDIAPPGLDAWRVYLCWRVGFEPLVYGEARIMRAGDGSTAADEAWTERSAA